MPSDRQLQKWAVVTGSSTGIGRAIAVKLAQSGFDLVIHGRKPSAELDQTRSLVEECGQRTAVAYQDFLEGNAAESFFEQVVSEVEQFVLWINNAGMDVLTGEVANSSFEEKLDKLIAVDVRATLKLSRLAGQRMKETRFGPRDTKATVGSIINIGWDQAFAGIGGESGQLFSTSKGAIMAMTGSLAKSFAPSVRVNCVAPGWIKTDWGDSASEYWQQRASSESLLNRWGTVDDVACLVDFLASDNAAFINGQVVNINGGFAGSKE